MHLHPPSLLQIQIWGFPLLTVRLLAGDILASAHWRHWDLVDKTWIWGDCRIDALQWLFLWLGHLQCSWCLCRAWEGCRHVRLIAFPLMLTSHSCPSRPACLLKMWAASPQTSTISRCLPAYPYWKDFKNRNDFTHALLNLACFTSRLYRSWLLNCS